MGSKIKVVAKTFEVLETLNRKNKLSLKEITEIVAFPKPTVFRLLYTLQTLGYVEQENGTQSYKLSSKFMSFVKGANSSNNLTILAKPYMEELRNEFNETVNLARLVDNQAVYIRVVESNQTFRISDNIGDRASFHSTSIGKAIIAFLPINRRKEILKNHSFTRFAKKTVLNIEDFERELIKVKKQGFSIDDEEGHDGVICIGAPIFDKDHHSFAALSISIPKVRAKKLILDKIKKGLPKVGIQISLDLGVTDIREYLINR